jgi:hypothetical protein
VQIEHKQFSMAEYNAMIGGMQEEVRQKANMHCILRGLFATSNSSPAQHQILALTVSDWTFCSTGQRLGREAALCNGAPAGA